MRLVFDVGGAKCPEIPEGSLDVKLDKVISAQGYDIFTPQPVQGARAYFMHNIIENIAGAMEKGYPRLLIHGSLISSSKPLVRVTTSNLAMMACLLAKERTENEWGQLVESAGQKVVKIWRPPHSVEGIIEAELA
ncbi:hypothetical protein BDZ45DRAFT_762615 [Acephala macrosclerotiorum]|nr:hypothetical protein BDZ45DRAFT_762615 [Acephala macrosclerotiorum]